jgi:hypothetical protein
LRVRLGLGITLNQCLKHHRRSTLRFDSKSTMRIRKSRNDPGFRLFVSIIQGGERGHTESSRYESLASWRFTGFLCPISLLPLTVRWKRTRTHSIQHPLPPLLLPLIPTFQYFPLLSRRKNPFISPRSFRSVFDNRFRCRFRYLLFLRISNSSP